MTLITTTRKTRVDIMPDQEAAAHSMCVSLRLDSATLQAMEQERGGMTLSSTMNTRICGALSALASNANKVESDDK